MSRDDFRIPQTGLAVTQARRLMLAGRPSGPATVTGLRQGNPARYPDRPPALRTTLSAPRRDRPPRARRSAIAAPMPRADPVTSATLPSSTVMSFPSTQAVRRRHSGGAGKDPLEGASAVCALGWLARRLLHDSDLDAESGVLEPWASLGDE